MITQYQCPKTGRTCEVTGCTGCWTTERQWVDLTDDEILKAIGAESYDEYSERGLANAILDARAVIAAFKAKQGENNV